MSSNFLGGGRNRAWRYRGFLVRVSGEQDRGLWEEKGEEWVVLATVGWKSLGFVYL